MIGTALLLATLAMQPQDSPERVKFEPWTFSAPGSTGEEFLIQVPEEKMDQPKISPKNKWQFNWIFPGMAKVPAAPEIYTLRFRTYVQDRSMADDVGPIVTRMLLQLWGYNVRILKLEHSERYFRQLVDVYLCTEGKAGGEQLFGEDPTNVDAQGRPRKSNQIYIYKLETFKNPLERAREVAHEYGHATLPAIGGYKTPEYWANGNLGEMIYLTWMRNELRSQRMLTIDTLGAKVNELDQYVATKVDPLMVKAAQTQPSASVLGKEMNAFLGLASFVHQCFPARVFYRSLLLCGTSGSEYGTAVKEAAEELPELIIKIPSSLKGKPIWVPINSGKIKGYTPIKKVAGWAQIKPNSATVTILNP